MCLSYYLFCILLYFFLIYLDQIRPSRHFFRTSRNRFWTVLMVESFFESHFDINTLYRTTIIIFYNRKITALTLAINFSIKKFDKSRCYSLGQGSTEKNLFTFKIKQKFCIQIKTWCNLMKNVCTTARKNLMTLHLKMN